MLLMPRFLLPDVFHLTDDFLQSHQIRGIIFDIDNTLVGFRTPEPTPEVRALLERLRSGGIQIAFVSNNNKIRVSRFAKGLDIPAYHRACKPLGVVLKRVQRRFDLPAGQIALVGDQIYTDVLGGNRAGMITILVDPIDCKETALFKFKGRMEMPVIQRKKREDAQK